MCQQNQPPKLAAPPPPHAKQISRLFASVIQSFPNPKQSSKPRAKTKFNLTTCTPHSPEAPSWDHHALDFLHPVPFGICACNRSAPSVQHSDHNTLSNMFLLCLEQEHWLRKTTHLFKRRNVQSRNCSNTAKLHEKRWKNLHWNIRSHASDMPILHALSQFVQIYHSFEEDWEQLVE